jgi:tRNA dimethylallyltransferase
VPHHLIDIRDPSELFSISDYLAEVAHVTHQIRSRGREVLFVGGTPLYLKSLLRGMYEGPPADEAFRQEVRAEADAVGMEALHRRLQQVDPLSAAKLHPRDTRRIIRALEVHWLTGQPISHQQLQFDEGMPAESCRVFVLDWPRPILHQRINDRVAGMFQAGFVDEVQNLLTHHGTLSRTALQAVGYQEVIRHLTEGLSLERTIETTQARTRQFAKRQITWFRSLSECRWVPRREDQPSEELLELILAQGRAVRPPQTGN